MAVARPIHSSHGRSERGVPERAKSGGHRSVDGEEALPGGGPGRRAQLDVNRRYGQKTKWMVVKVVRHRQGRCGPCIPACPALCPTPPTRPGGSAWTRPRLVPVQQRMVRPGPKYEAYHTKYDV